MFTTRNLLIFIARHAVIAFGTMGVAFLLIIFFANKIETIADTIVKNRTLATTLEKRTELLSTLKHDRALIGENDKKIEGAFLRADNILEFIAVLEDLALRNGVTQAFSFSVPTPTEYSASFPVSAITYSNTINGTATTITQYLKEFESLPYFTKINSMNISSQDKTLGIRGQSSVSYQASLFTKSAQ